MSWRIIPGDVREGLRSLEAGSVQCVVTSPPYFGLRDYGIAGQIGMEATPQEFVCTLVEVFREVRRVLRDDGVCFVNLGDSYAGSGKGPSNSLQPDASQLGARNTGQFASGQAPTQWQPIARGLKAKDLCLIPERFAIAMQEDGWYVRSRIAWCKTACMPESVTDRPTNAWEHIWLFTKSRTYFWDQDAVRVESAPSSLRRDGLQKTPSPKELMREEAGYQPGLSGAYGQGRNLWSYWLLGPEPLKDEHYAAYPTEIPRLAISAGTSERGCCPTCGAPWRRTVERTAETYNTKEGVAQALRNAGATSGGTERDTLGVTDQVVRSTTGWQPACTCPNHEPVPCTVLDPFVGSGTTLLVAERLGRNSIGIELSPTYVELARKRINGDAPLWNVAAEVSTASADGRG